MADHPSFPILPSFPGGMKAVLSRLLTPRAPGEAGIENAQGPAIECQVLLKSGYRASGALSTTAEGTLRLLMPASLENPQNKHKPKNVLAEHFFDYADVEAIITFHEIPEVVANGGLILPGPGSNR